MLGVPISRNWVVMMRSGVAAVDWGDGLFQDVLSGDFFRATEQEVSHRAGDAELDWLKLTGSIDAYDADIVYIVGLPERPNRSLL